MGSCCNCCLKSSKDKVLLLGLDAAGKTTIFYRLVHGTYPKRGSEYGFNVGDVTHGNYSMVMWDVKGQEKIRDTWCHFYSDTQAIIFVVDSNDKERMGGIFVEEMANIITNGYIRDCYTSQQSHCNEDVCPQLPSELLPLIAEYCRDLRSEHMEDSAQFALHKTMQDDGISRDAILLILANKQDLPNAISTDEIVLRLALWKLKDRHWYIHPTIIGHTGEGLIDGLEWIRDNVRRREHCCNGCHSCHNRVVNS